MSDTQVLGSIKISLGDCNFLISISYYFYLLTSVCYLLDRFKIYWFKGGMLLDFNLIEVKAVNFAFEILW